ncbi:YeeE/YedE family protein [Mangrovitalea sediminis]|uniref:YeeE/YedE family protein n=1 Tax=Mangrovitalea sediminis TaxID=1982043 RepID=UPI000BE5D80A|nr:YeeE/YedE family protein [Mangrovitalea sediminis]
MKRNLVALVSGTLFGLGLSVSQMINPAKVLAFLDVAGHWDPSLALVMASALSVMAIAWRWQRKTASAVSRPLFSSSGLRDVDAPLVIGAALFGVGWGLVGYCPGPALAALSLLNTKPVIFVVAMLGGMAVHHFLYRRRNAELAQGESTDYCG